MTHELNNFTMSEAMKFYAQLKAAFKYIVPMGVATNVSQPYVESNYTMPNFEQCRFSRSLRDEVVDMLFPRYFWDHDHLGHLFLSHCCIWSIESKLGLGLEFEFGHQRGETLGWWFGRAGCVGRILGWPVEIVDVEKDCRVLSFFL